VTVLFIIDSLGVGGAERSTLDLCVFLRHHNITSAIVCLRNRSEGVQQEAIHAGIDVTFLRAPGIFGQLREFNEVCTRVRPDIVHTTLFKSRLRGRLHKLLYRRKYALVESLVTMPFSDQRIAQRRQSGAKIFGHKLIDALLSRPVNKYVAISEEVKSHAVKQLFLQKSRDYKVIYRGRDENRFINDKETLRDLYASELKFDRDAIVFIHVGRQDFPKNHLFLLRAFLQLLETTCCDKQRILLCVGRRGDMSGEIDKLMSESIHGALIHFLGHRYDVEKLLAQSDVFVFPSLFEGLGGSVIEAKAAELPLVVSDIEVFKEMLAEDEAIFIQHDRVESFVSAMQLLAMDSTLRELMGKKNLESFKRKFLKQTVNVQMLDLYKQLINEDSSARY